MSHPPPVSTTSPRVLLATCREHADGEPGHEALDRALAGRGLRASWAIWDDPAVAWERADLVAVRATWDYMERLDEFLRWARRLDRVLLHGARVFGWNTDKRYLLELREAGVPVVPSALAATADDVRALVQAPGAWVVKPAVGANGVGVAAVVREGWRPTTPGPWLVQPLLESVRTEGETSVFVIDGRVATQLLKTPASGGFLVHEQFGGRTRPVALTAEASALAAQAHAAAERVTDTSLRYARVDLLRHEGRLVVNEIEVTEPGLYLDVLPENALPFADMLARRLGA